MDNSLIQELKNSLAEIKAHLDTRGEKICQHELSMLEASILEYGQGLPVNNQEKLQEIVRKIIHHINLELQKKIPMLESEMHGVQNYSAYEFNRVNRFAVKQSLKNDLEKMLAKFPDQKSSPRPR